MKITNSTLKSLLFILIALLTLSNCKKEDDNQDDNGNALYFSFYASRDPMYFDPVKNCDYTSFTFDGGGFEELTDSLTVTIDGDKMGRYPSGFYYYNHCGRYNDGDIVKVKITHPSWGNLEFDYLFPDKPDTVYYNPEISQWIKNIADNNPDNDGLTVEFPSTTYCNDFFSFINIYASMGDTNFSNAEYKENHLVFENSSGNQDWINIKNKFLSSKEINIWSSFGWQQIHKWDNHCQIKVYCVSQQISEMVKFPVNINGTWDLVADYTAISGFYTTNVNNETDILSFNQDGAKFTISTHNNIQGSVDGKNIYFEGDILPGDGHGGTQSFNGTLEGNSITGYISGTVMTQFPGQSSPESGTITNSSFTLVKRTE
jgi:hypothetical protein